MHVQPVQPLEVGQPDLPVLPDPPDRPATAADRESVTTPMPPPTEAAADLLRERLRAARRRARTASSWAGVSRRLGPLLNQDQVVPVSARLTSEDLYFLDGAREEVLALTGAALRMTELHRPLEDGGVGCDPAGGGPRCKNCMWRWPCPTFRILSQILDPGPR
jgi:hypothetical protein